LRWIKSGLTGDSVNIAARLEGVCDPSRAIWRSVEAMKVECLIRAYPVKTDTHYI
jgi:hypothetical protein